MYASVPSALLKITPCRLGYTVLLVLGIRKLKNVPDHLAAGSLRFISSTDPYASSSLVYTYTWLSGALFAISSTLDDVCDGSLDSAGSEFALLDSSGSLEITLEN